MVATCADLSPRTTPPFQNTKAAKEKRRAIYGYIFLSMKRGWEEMAIAMLIAVSPKSVGVSSYW